jgi:hypothetical protein
LGSPKHPADPKGKHNALVDAKWNKKLYECLMSYKKEKLTAFATKAHEKGVFSVAADIASF